jgi:hypothetical protein
MMRRFETEIGLRQKSTHEQFKRGSHAKMPILTKPLTMMA